MKAAGQLRFRKSLLFAAGKGRCIRGSVGGCDTSGWKRKLHIGCSARRSSHSMGGQQFYWQEQTTWKMLGKEKEKTQ